MSLCLFVASGVCFLLLRLRAQPRKRFFFFFFFFNELSGQDPYPLPTCGCAWTRCCVAGKNVLRPFLRVWLTPASAYCVAGMSCFTYPAAAGCMCVWSVCKDVKLHVKQGHWAFLDKPSATKLCLGRGSMT